MKEKRQRFLGLVNKLLRECGEGNYPSSWDEEEKKKRVGNLKCWKEWIEEGMSAAEIVMDYKMEEIEKAVREVRWQKLSEEERRKKWAEKNQEKLGMIEFIMIWNKRRK